jgi:hypothetical protein
LQLGLGWRLLLRSSERRDVLPLGRRRRGPGFTRCGPVSARPERPTSCWSSHEARRSRGLWRMRRLRLPRRATSMSAPSIDHRPNDSPTGPRSRREPSK